MTESFLLRFNVEAQQKLDKSCICRELWNSRFDYTYILEYLCRVSFLTTLDIYKGYFKSRYKWCKALQNNNLCILWPETEFALVHHILSRSYCVFTPRFLWPMSFLIIISWSSLLINWRTLQPKSFSVLVTYWDLYIKGFVTK